MTNLNYLITKCANELVEKSKEPERVRVVIPYKGKYLLERLSNPKWPENYNKRRFMGGGIEVVKNQQKQLVVSFEKN